MFLDKVADSYNIKQKSANLGLEKFSQIDQIMANPKIITLIRLRLLTPLVPFSFSDFEPHFVTTTWTKIGMF